MLLDCCDGGMFSISVGGMLMRGSGNQAGVSTVSIDLGLNVHSRIKVHSTHRHRRSYLPRCSDAHHENNVLGRVVADGKLEELDLVPVRRERAQKLCPKRTRTAPLSIRRPRSSTRGTQETVRVRLTFCLRWIIL